MRPQLLRGGEGTMQMKGPIFRLARGILLHMCDNVASSYINILWISFVSRRSNRTQTHTNAHAVRDRPSLKDGERQFRPRSFHELQDNSNETQTNSNEAKNASDNAEMMVHVDESLNFHTSRNSYVNLSQDSCDKIEKANLACISIEIRLFTASPN